MKLIINAEGVRELLKIDPEGTVELAKNAAANVAQEMANRIAKKAEKESFDNIKINIRNYLTKWTNIGHVLSDDTKKLVEKAIEEGTTRFLKSGANRELMELAHAQVKASVQYEVDALEDLMRTSADRIISERMAAIFTEAVTPKKSIVEKDKDGSA